MVGIKNINLVVTGFEIKSIYRMKLKQKFKKKCRKLSNYHFTFEILYESDHLKIFKKMRDICKERIGLTLPCEYRIV